VKKVVRFGNLDSSLRIKFWVKFCPFFQVQQQVREELKVPPEVNNLYQHIQNSLQENCTDIFMVRLNENVRDDISKDLKRTFTAERMKTEEG